MKEEKVIYDPAKVSDTGKILSGIEEVLKIGGREFTRLRTSSTATYITKDKIIKVIPKSGLKGNDIKFISMVKKHFSNLPTPKQISSGRPFYEYFRPFGTYQDIDNVWEIDLNAAYWTAAKNLGYIGDDIYNLAFSSQISKKARLIGVGVLGKKTVTSEFRPPYVDVETSEEYAHTRPFWDNIVYEVGEVMREVVKQYKPLVYGLWFDAIFVDGAAVEPVRKFLQRRGYPVKSKKIDSYIVEPLDGIVPGAKITRKFANGDEKEMSVNYLQAEDKYITFEQFLEKVAKSPYL